MQNRAPLFLALAVIGAIVPLVLFGIWIADEGLDFGEMGDLVFDNLVTTALLADLTIASLAFLIWMWPQAKAIGKSPWLFVAVNGLVGLCCALPLFLYFRESAGVREPLHSPDA